MLTRQNYEMLKEKYGKVSSWAIWLRAGETAKSNTDSLNWVHDPDLLYLINTGFVFVGLKASNTHGYQNGHFQKAWSAFHSGYRYQNDYKLRYALQDTRYWGSYITDVIKNHDEVNSEDVMSFLSEHPEVVFDGIKELKKELSYLGDKPVLVAMGDQAYRILREHLNDEYRIVKIISAAYTIGQEDYRKKVLAVLDDIELDN